MLRMSVVIILKVIILYFERLGGCYMKKLKSSLILWSILLIITLIFFSSISIFADSNQSNELNSKLRNGSILENTKKLKEIGAILDKYVSPFDYYEETILSKNYDDKLDVISAMLSRYNKASKEEQAEFDIYLNDIFEVLKNEQPRLEVFEFERRYKLLKGSNDTSIHDIRSYLLGKYPELFKKFQSEDLWLLEEVLEENAKVGRIIDRYTGNTDNFKEKALSGYYKDREDTIAAILSIFNRVSDSERDILDGFVSASLSSLESDHPSSKVFVMKQRFYSITGRDKQTGELNKKYNFSHSSSSEKYLVDTYDIEELKEEIEFETNIGKTLDSYTGNKGNFEEKAISLFYKDRQEVVNAILNIYDKVSDSDKFQFEVYVSACLSTLEDEYPSKYVDELKMRYKAISKKELLKNNKVTPKYQSHKNNTPILTELVNTLKNLKLSSNI